MIILAKLSPNVSRPSSGFRCDVTKMEEVVALYNEAEEHFKDKVLSVD